LFQLSSNTTYFVVFEDNWDNKDNFLALNPYRFAFLQKQIKTNKNHLVLNLAIIKKITGDVGNEFC